MLVVGSGLESDEARACAGERMTQQRFVGSPPIPAWERVVNVNRENLVRSNFIRQFEQVRPGLFQTRNRPLLWNRKDVDHPPKTFTLVCKAGCGINWYRNSSFDSVRNQ